MARSAVALTSAVLVAAGGCSTNALITRTNDLPVEVEIVGGSPHSVFVRDSYGEAFIPRDEIVDVDHPGPWGILGGFVIGLGIIAPGWPSIGSCSSKEPVRCAGAFLPLAAGAAFVIWGAVVYNDSVTAYRDQSRGESGRPLPSVRVTKRRVAPDHDDTGDDAPSAHAPDGPPAPAGSGPAPTTAAPTTPSPPTP